MMAQQLATRPDLPDRLLNRIVMQSDGVPLFIEELTKAVVEAAPNGTSPQRKWWFRQHCRHP